VPRISKPLNFIPQIVQFKWNRFAWLWVEKVRITCHILSENVLKWPHTQILVFKLFSQYVLTEENVLTEKKIKAELVQHQLFRTQNLTFVSFETCVNCQLETFSEKKAASYRIYPWSYKPIAYFHCIPFKYTYFFCRTFRGLLFSIHGSRIDGQSKHRSSCADVVCA